jgi:hypothetical protein
VPRPKNLFWDSCCFIRLLTRSPIELVGDLEGTIEEFFAHWRSAFHPFDPNPNILIAAGRLRDAAPINPNPKDSTNRTVGAADSIHLATCLFLRDIGNEDIVFHTFDEGKSSTSHEGKPLPIIGFERWFPEASRTVLVTDVCNLTRCKPEHPTPDLVARSSQ